MVEQAVGLEGASEGGASAARESVDAGGLALSNARMAHARAGSEPTSLEERLGISGIERSAPKQTDILRTGVDSLDQALEGGLRAGVLTEIAVSAPSSGGQTLILHMLEGIRREQRFAALVDGCDSFDPQSAPPDLLEHLLWARCGTALEAMKVADALLRDENFGMVLVDLRGLDARQLRRVKSADWYRLQRLAERTSAYVSVFTPKAMIPSAQIRIALEASLPLELADASVTELGASMEFEVQRLRQLEVQEFPNLITRATG